MADWFVSSVAWAAIPQFAASGVYSVGNIVRPLTAPAFGAQYAFRCTTAGTASTEPAWPAANNATVTTGGAVFTNVSGQSTYGWSAAAGNLWEMSFQGASPRAVAGDRIFLSSDHSETSTNQLYGHGPAGFGSVAAISVNRAGSVPPTAADYLAGATIAYSGASDWRLDCVLAGHWEGITFNLGGSGNAVYFAYTGTRMSYYRNCAFVLSTSNTLAYFGTNNPGKVTFDNTTFQFNAAGQRFFTLYPMDMIWNGSALLGTAPTVLFSGSSLQAIQTFVVRGVDLSGVTGTLCYGASGVGTFIKALFDSCRIAPGVVRLGTGGYTDAADEVELVNCYDGTSFVSERHAPSGDMTTEFTITLLNGAADNVGTFSHKMISSTRCDRYALTLDSFWMDTNYATTGGSKTASVEIISSGTLNTDDIALVVEYEGTAGSSRASFVSSFPTVAPTTPVAITTSTATWNSSPATPVRQRLSVTFTPQTAGRVRAQVRLGKPSTTVYVNPQVTIA